MDQDATALQRTYYETTADQYSSMHVHSGDEHHRALQHIVGFFDLLGVESVLDVGAGTGRAASFIRCERPDITVVAAEPVAALLEQGRREGRYDGVGCTRSSGYLLPFSDGSVDAVCEAGVLHHVADPAAVVGEMLRVARKAVFLSDNNRFGQGSMLAGMVKLAMWKTRMWKPFIALRSRGRGYYVTEGDGVAYSYSVYDTFGQLAAWADRLVAIDTGPPKQASSWVHPLLTSQHVLLAALRERAAAASSSADGEQAQPKE